MLFLIFFSLVPLLFILLLAVSHCLSGGVSLFRRRFRLVHVMRYVHVASLKKLFPVVPVTPGKSSTTDDSKHRRRSTIYLQVQTGVVCLRSSTENIVVKTSDWVFQYVYFKENNDF